MAIMPSSRKNHETIQPLVFGTCSDIRIYVFKENGKDYVYEVCPSIAFIHVETNIVKCIHVLIK